MPSAIDRLRTDARDHSRPVGSGDDRLIGNTPEESVLDDAGHLLQSRIQRLGIVDPAKVAVEDVVAVLGDYGFTTARFAQDLTGATDLRGERGEQIARCGQPEAHSLGGKWEGAEGGDALRPVGDDDHA